MNANNATCELCNECAAIQYSDPKTKNEHFYCGKHSRADEVVQQASNWIRVRKRYLPIGNILSKKIGLPQDTEEHQAFKWEMCEGQLLGGQGAVRYYFSMITGCDYFSAWDDKFNQDITKFLIARTSPRAAQFIDNEFSPHWLDCMTDFLGHLWEQQQGMQTKITKQVKAIELLLKHPEWSDEKIAEKVPTTIGQLQKNTNYKTLRSIPIRRANAQAK